MDNKKILVIDDEKGIREVVSDFLEDKGFVVVTAENGTDGFRKVLTEHPALVLLDVELPDMSGYEVCEKIRNDPSSRHTPIIMLTAHSLEKEELHGFSVGADDYVAKPFKPSRLLARINTAIGRNVRELDANALTHLPGNRPIMEEIQNRISGEEKFSVLYFDLNDFKAFNDRYGFVRGDEAIKMTARVLSEIFAKESHRAFLGHVGGDDFVGVLDSHYAGDLCKKIVRTFDASVLELYDEDDRKRGMIASVDRRGNKVDIPIMGLAIAVVTNRQKKFTHPGEIALIAGDLKKWAKSAQRSAYVIDRRT